MTIISLNTNTLTSVTNRALNHSTKKITNSVKKLTTGKRVNGAGDDIASLSIAAKIDTDLRGISKAKQNIIDQRGHLDTLHGAFLSSIESVQKMRELFVQGLNDINSEDELNALQRQLDAYKQSYDDSLEMIKVINGSQEKIAHGGAPDSPEISYTNYVQTGSKDSQGFIIDYTSTLGSPKEPDAIGFAPEWSQTRSFINSGIFLAENRLDNLKIPGATIDEVPLDNSVIDNTDTDTLEHLDTILSNMTRMSGVYQADITRLDETYVYLEGQEIALSKSKSHFVDTDIAEESTRLTRERLRQQSAAAMATQTNAQGQFVLSLLP